MGFFGKKESIKDPRKKFKIDSFEGQPCSIDLRYLEAFAVEGKPEWVDDHNEYGEVIGKRLICKTIIGYILDGKVKEWHMTLTKEGRESLIADMDAIKAERKNLKPNNMQRYTRLLERAETCAENERKNARTPLSKETK